MAVIVALTAVLIVVGGLLLLFGWRFVTALLRGEQGDEAAADAAGGTARYVGAVVGVVGAGLIGFADVLDVVLNAVAQSPVVVSNAIVGALGALGIAGLVDVTLIGYGLLVIVIVGGVLVIREARRP